MEGQLKALTGAANGTAQGTAAALRELDTLLLEAVVCTILFTILLSYFVLMSSCHCTTTIHCLCVTLLSCHYVFNPPSLPYIMYLTLLLYPTLCI
jgi:hypothetical protein